MGRRRAWKKQKKLEYERLWAEDFDRQMALDYPDARDYNYDLARQKTASFYAKRRPEYSGKKVKKVVYQRVYPKYVPLPKPTFPNYPKRPFNASYLIRPKKVVVRRPFSQAYRMAFAKQAAIEKRNNLLNLRRAGKIPQARYKIVTKK